MNKVFKHIAVTLLVLFLIDTLPAQAFGKVFNINNPKAATSNTVATGTASNSTFSTNSEISC